jgi:hypothetical protein
MWNSSWNFSWNFGNRFGIELFEFLALHRTKQSNCRMCLNFVATISIARKNNKQTWPRLADLKMKIVKYLCHPGFDSYKIYHAILVFKF